MHLQTAKELKPIPDANAHTRASLIARVREWSDDESWQEFFDLYWKLIYALALRADLSESEAEEAVQATMISISKSIREFRYTGRPGSFRSWICRQAFWRIKDQLRKRMHEQNLFQRSVSDTAEAANPRTATASRVPDTRNALEAFLEKDWEQAVERLALERVRATVKAKHFQIFDLYVLKRWPIREVARLLQVSPAQIYLVKSRLSRLLRKTARQVTAQLETLPPGIRAQNL